MKAGYAYCEATEAFQVSYEVPPAKLAPGIYRNISGNNALALGFVAAAQQAGLRLFLGSYPITPASDILHELSMYKNFGVITFQAEDEIAAIASAIGAAFARRARDHHHLGPGHGAQERGDRPRDHGRAAARDRRHPARRPLDRPADQDRAGRPASRRCSAATPRRRCRCSRPATPGDCFWVALEASRIALKYMMPVILLSDGYLANGAEPWRIPTLDELPEIPVTFRTDPEGFLPYERDPQTLARPWAVPGTPGLEHRIGGLEKQDVTGNVNYEPLNHERMVQLRAAEGGRRSRRTSPTSCRRAIPTASCWSSAGARPTARSRRRCARSAPQGHRIGHVHLRYLNPLPDEPGRAPEALQAACWCPR